MEYFRTFWLKCKVNVFTPMEDMGKSVVFPDLFQLLTS